MRVNLVLFVLVACIMGAGVVSLAPAQARDAGVEGLKQEMDNVPAAPAAEAAAPAAAAVEGDAQKKPEQPKEEAPKKVEAAAPVIEELAPAPKKEPEAKPAEAAKPAAPVIEELAPAPAAAPAAAEPKKEEPAAAQPAAPAEKKEAKAGGLDDLLPAPAPVAAAPAEAKPAEVAKPAADLDPDAATKHALEDAIKGFGSPDRLKLGTSVAQQEDVRRKARELEGRKAVENGDKAWKDGDYATAADQYKVAYSKLPMVAACQALRARANERIPECEFEIIRKMVKEGKTDDATVNLAEEFLKQRPNNPPLKSLVTKLKEKKSTQVDTGASTLGGPAHEGETEVQKQMRLGKEFMVNREYVQSRACFESVLGMEPDNREAMRYLKVLGDRDFDTRSVERSATVKKMVSEVRDTWNPKYKVIKGREVAAEKKVEAPKVNLIEEKMKKIVIDEIEFRQANMHDVVDFLNKRSHEMDKTTDDETKKGVNIILKLGNSAAPAAPAKAGGDDVFGGENQNAAGAASGVPEVTFSARYITLFNALKVITDVAGLRWRVDGEIVMIVPKEGDNTEPMELRMYPVEPTFIEKVRTASTEMPVANKTIGGKEVTQLGGGGIGDTVPTDLKPQFEAMGIKFPKGATINYSQAIGKVIVMNTLDNLTAFEKLLAELNVVPKQVEIEARFVEVNETDLYEAGLEWLLTDNWEMLMKNSSSAYSPATSDPRIQMNASTADGGVTKGLRFWGVNSDNKQALMGGGQGALGNIASFSSILTNPDLTLVLHALEQNGNADLLSAPKVTTRSGTEATIKVVTEYIYPTSFEVQGGQFNNNNSGNNNSSSIVQETTVVPQDFATREVGVILNVLPEVSPDGNMINLTMKPSVVTDPIWYQYGSTVRRADGSTMQMNMPQPFFQTRTLETQISIYDGATVVMGGLITESVDKANDRIPILGDIPFVGALFRSKSEKSIKKNLLIFVTAKLVDPAGHLIRTQEQELAKPPAVAPGATATPSAAK